MEMKLPDFLGNFDIPNEDSLSISPYLQIKLINNSIRVSQYFFLLIYLRFKLKFE